MKAKTTNIKPISTNNLQLNLVTKYLFGIIVFMSCIFNANSQFSSYSNEYLNIGIDASSLARGNSVIASTHGVCSGYWNPAGLSKMQSKFETSLMHANYFSGLAQFDYLGFSYKASDSLMLGLSVIRFGVDDIPNTLELVDENGNVNYDRITYFSVADYALFLSLAKISKINGLSWGGSLKLIYRKQGEFASAYGFGFDAGAQYRLGKWRFGLNLRDATSTFNIWIFKKELFEEVFTETGNEIPTNSLELTSPKLLAGFAREFTFNQKLTLLAELDFDLHFDGEHHSLIKAKPISIDPHFGLEFRYLNNIFLRAGIDRFQIVEDFDNTETLMLQPSIGIGFSLFGLSLDYALTDVGDMTIAPVSHIFSLKYSFGK